MLIALWPLRAIGTGSRAWFYNSRGEGMGELTLRACVGAYRVCVPFLPILCKVWLSLSFSLARSLAHTHAHTHTRLARAALKYAGAKSQDSASLQAFIGKVVILSTTCSSCFRRLPDRSVDAVLSAISLFLSYRILAGRESPPPPAFPGHRISWREGTLSSSPAGTLSSVLLFRHRRRRRIFFPSYRPFDAKRGIYIRPLLLHTQNEQCWI